MRYLFGLLCVCALGLMPLVGCSETRGDDGSFDIVRDGQKQSYDSTRIALKERDSQLVLWAWNMRGSMPDVEDDGYSDVLRIVFDKDALDELATDQDHPISGEGSWTSTSVWIDLDEVTFTATETHTAAVDHMLFARHYFGCIDEEDDFGAQTFQGTLSLTTIAEGQLAGAIEVRVEGDVPCTDNLHQFYELTLVFDQRYGGMGPDAGTDAGADAGSDAGS